MRGAFLALCAFLLFLLQGSDLPGQDIGTARAGGNAQAQTRIGLFYENGWVVPVDQGEAVRRYRLAAEQGDAEGQRKLGNCFYAGRGTQRDYTEAAKWFRKAAEQGDAASQNNLGALYPQRLAMKQNMP